MLKKMMMALRCVRLRYVCKNVQFGIYLLISPATASANRVNGLEGISKFQKEIQNTSDLHLLVMK